MPGGFWIAFLIWVGLAVVITSTMIALQVRENRRGG